jgi:hypothetical protein
MSILQDVIADENMHLDNFFRISMATDIVNVRIKFSTCRDAVVRLHYVRIDSDRVAPQNRITFFNCTNSSLIEVSLIENRELGTKRCANNSVFRRERLFGWKTASDYAQSRNVFFF